MSGSGCGTAPVGGFAAIGAVLLLEKWADLLKIRTLPGIRGRLHGFRIVSETSQPGRIHSVSVSCVLQPEGLGLLCPLWWHTMRAFTGAARRSPHGLKQSGGSRH